ncbi:MAG TPA: amidohydrolase family protein [Polyangiaceae bacterium]|nr:amidohydrolase family protein [Polyangiaceae bacterium]
MRKSLLPVLWLAAACGAEPVHPAAPVAPASAPATASTPAPAAVEAKTTKRVVVVLSRKAGTSVSTVAPDGTVTVTLDVLENGRGPHTDATVRFAPDGTIASLEARGHHTMGTPVAETFTRDGARAQWKSHEEDGSRELKGSAFFVPVCDLPEALGWLAKALLDNGGTLPLLPGGSAHIEKTVETTVRAGAEQRKVAGYVITGLDLVPTHVWLNEDKSWFGFINAWQSVVPEGWESAIEPLLAKQTEIDRDRDHKLAQTLAKKPAAGFAFTNARVLDVEKGRYLADQTVVVVGDTIQSIGAAKGAKVPKDAEVIDLAGKTLVPGLWDMHAHLGDVDGVLNIASGVTTVRDVGNDPDKLDDYKKRFDDGSAVGPHVIRFGFIEGRGDKAASSKVTAETEAEAKAGVESYAKRGYEGIKIYNSMKPELVPVIAKEAHARNMMVTGHIPVHMLANEAVRAGYDGIEHINMLFLNFFADHDTDTRTTKRFTLVGDKAASFDLGSKPVTDFIALLKDRHTVIDPTLNAFEGLLVGEQGKVIPGLENVVNRLPVQAQRFFLTGGLPLDADKIKTYRASFDKLLEMTKRLYAAKVPVVAGTDALAGLMLHHELALLVRAGLSPADVLRADTIDAARAMKLDKKSGSIAKGKVADLIVVEGDPLAHIEDLAAVVTTVRGGVLFPSAPLYEAAGVRPSSK